LRRKNGCRQFALRYRGDVESGSCRTRDETNFRRTNLGAAVEMGWGSFRLAGLSYSAGLRAAGLPDRLADTAWRVSRLQFSSNDRGPIWLVEFSTMARAHSFRFPDRHNRSRRQNFARAR